MTGYAFERARHERAAHLRADDAWRQFKSNGGTTRVMVLGGEHVATVDGPALRWIDLSDAPDGEHLWLGELDGVGHAAVVVDRVPQELAPVSLRILAPLLQPEQLSLAVHAVAMARWLAGSQYCPRCGARTEVRAAGHLRSCPACGADHFPRTDPAVIMLVTDAADRALLGRSPQWPEGRFSTLAGFVEPGENLEDAVRREVAEEVGIVVGDVEYAGSQPWPFPSSLMVGFFAHAETTEITLDPVEMAEAAWFSREELTEFGRAGTVLLPPSFVSISRWLIDSWHGGELEGKWR